MATEQLGMATEPLVIALTMGEPGSIALEITFKAWKRRTKKPKIPPFILLDDPSRVAQKAQEYGCPIIPSTPEKALKDFASGLPVFAPPVVLERKKDAWEAGEPQTVSAIRSSLECGVMLVQQGRVKGITTNPVTKASLSLQWNLLQGNLLQGNPFQGSLGGQTECLASLCKHVFGEKSLNPVMLFWGERVKIAIVTRHIPVKEIHRMLTVDRIYQTITTINTHLQSIKAQKGKGGNMALLGLNPHAGEGGLLGDEEQTILLPALEKCRQDGIPIKGVFSPDGFFARDYQQYDVIVAMYHDQGLIPVKILEPYPVNTTLGLPLIRTSPCHGTARHLGQNKADEGGLCAALRLCDRLC